MYKQDPPQAPRLLLAPAFSQREYSVSPVNSPTSGEPVYRVVEQRRTIYVSSSTPLTDGGQWKDDLSDLFRNSVDLEAPSTTTYDATSLIGRDDGGLRIVCEPENLSGSKSRRQSRHEQAASPYSTYVPPPKSASPKSSPPASASKATRRPPRSAPVRGKLHFYDRDESFYGFTNFSRHNVNYRGGNYSTSEHLFQSLKFLPHRPDIAERIRACRRPSEALSEARRHKEYQRVDWFHVNIQTMDEVLLLKFTQHPSLKLELLSTGDLELIEDSPVDPFWGIGKDGQGRNELGKALERLRDKFRRGLT